ncbi:zinc finger B-box domain-containing protein 1 isoform X2 [Dermochelys coriacea]|uniref:zinc finger B-box domain-containing protein 1 isoform X2 n=1 Tax=Dermochelys coriacea TaxID=27794 RepID=UPI0018E8750C|nr:zinc finger B-box domain-containing protein 1 isoform X2 [Dermochelys coriacea]XP_038273317.1 zinc finger B-box domain-containing protein 1 isoform X2 [Dermochelys coriacea]XP_038273318.1 zinc finger B-box domain-containing protein 1 isoform X2 [Dermochelys coriacea]XP_038273321.1 zinc finger B-box domain-containing protein 1 isoform X2 [Dermochelys coriacea]
MSINDFVILPGSKTGTSVKLKVKNVLELKLEKVQLELENKEMEKKLHQLQSNMSREKEERRERSSGYRWQSGQAGPLGIQPQVWSQNKENVVKVSSGKVKLKILKEQIHEPMKQPFIHKMANFAIPEKPKMKGKACGQCEAKNALLVCLECGEDYCGSCFARVHQKGALKLHRMIPLQAKTRVSVGKLEATHQFMKYFNPDESKENHEQKKANSKNQFMSDISSSLLMSTGNAEEVSTVPTGAVSENQNGGLLLYGTFDEEESAESFQEALTQWRNGGHEHKKEQNSDEAQPESMGVCEVQTHLTILRKPVKIEFKEESLNYMEKLWLQKHRRMPVNQISGIQADEFRPKHNLMNEPDEALSGGERGGDDDDDDLIVEDMKKYWTALFRAEKFYTVHENLESALKIEVLSDSCEEDLDESCNSVAMEVGSTKLRNEQRKRKSDAVPENQKDTISDFLPEPAASVTSKTSLNSASTSDKKDLFIPHDRSSVPVKENSKVSSARTSTVNHERSYTDCIHSSTEETVFSRPHESAVTEKESIKTKTYRRSLSACMSPEKTFDLLKLGSNEPSLMTRSLKNNTDSLEFNSFHTSKSLILPVTTEASVLLQEVALREKPTLTQYQGLEGFFILHTNSKQVRLDSVPSPFSDCSSTNSTSVSGKGCWFRDTSLSEYADDSVVQDVLQSELSRSSSSLELQNLCAGVSSWTLMHRSPTDNSFQRLLSGNIPSSKSMKSDDICCTHSQTRPRNLITRPLSRAATEISKIECIDVTEQNDPLLEYTADQQALAGLENELKSHTDLQEKLYSFTSEDLSAFSRHSKKISENITDFHNNLEIKYHSRVDIYRDYDESHTDEEEETLRDKQEVIALR